MYKMNKWQIKSAKCDEIPYIKKLHDNQTGDDIHFIYKRVTLTGVNTYKGESQHITKKGDKFKKSDLIKVYGIEQVEAMNEYKPVMDEIHKLQSKIRRLKIDYMKSTESAYFSLKMKRSHIVSDAKRAIYHEYLNSNDWQNKRQDAFNVYGKQCDMCCSREDGLNVHHKTYENIFNEDISDLQILCASCHSNVHS